MKLSAVVSATAFLVAQVAAHPGGHEVPHSEMVRRSALSKRCASAAASLNEKRYNRRMKTKRDLDERSGNTTYQITTEAPYYDVIQNDTCVLSPEVTEGPYVWPRSQTLRQDMTEDQSGVPLWLDIGLIDMATCEPLPNALVSFWHCNATGSYSSFTGLSPNTGFPDLLNELNITNFTIGETDLHTDATTWLRGMWPSNDQGMLEMKTVFPGFYVERAIHIHAQVYTDWKLHSNGTVSSGNIVSTGQLYFAEDLEQQIMALEPYASHTEINRTTNAADSVFDQDTEGGYNPVISVVAADGENVENGMIGYITIGVDTTAIEN
ncbi:Protocatechuate -dioxygenase beta subunit protein [Neofusicoccum parvum]|uniref:Protocatechuate -dioxygenase beta subunit protein n=1 Tax=Neofusicoccum parvum TaxID=310453 RepID=A0ACB5SKC1_9PEZI|nr:Protocatechuate -dioxygenase beta subunit protein [Neofusicoccum parvum]